jgi:hypothetical protein
MKKLTMKFSHIYRLKKDLPNYPKGWEFQWNGERELFYPRKKDEYNKNESSIYLDYKAAAYNIDQIKNTEWFEPVSKEVDFIPQFPSKDKIEDYVDLMPSLLLVKCVDQSRTLSKLFESKGFEDKLYEFLKESYNKFYNL